MSLYDKLFNSKALKELDELKAEVADAQARVSALLLEQRRLTEEKALLTQAIERMTAEIYELKKPKKAEFNPNAKDGDGDGKVQDGTTQERAAVKKPVAAKKPAAKKTK